MFSKYSKRELLTILAFAFAQFFNAICVSLQAPFFPKEAELKGATATEYGFVFGVFELVVFLVSPFYGKYLGKIGPRRMFYCGITTSAVSSILFGSLDLIDDHLLFISLAFLIRIIEAMGSAAFLTAGFAIIAHEFVDKIASTFASLETFFGMGLIVGPTLGGVLYQLGGYPAPFVTVGIFLFACALFTKIILPDLENYHNDGSKSDKIWQIFRMKDMSTCAGTIVTTTISISFIFATLEPHIRQFKLTPVQIGFMFVVNGAVYGISAPVWGWICDLKYVRPKAISILGGVIMLFGVSLLGPAPFLPLQTSIMYIIFGLMLHGLSVGARLVSSFSDALQIAINGGMPNAIETFGVISALWTSMVAFGSFVGPTLSGIFYDNFGFANASLFIIILISIMILFEIWALFNSSASKSEYKDDEMTEPSEAVSTTNLSTSKNTSTFVETYKVGISSNRVLNLVYNSNPDLRDETAPLSRHLITSQA